MSTLPPRAGLPGLALIVLLSLVPVASAQDFESDSLGPGESYSWTFDEPGEVTYHCHPHPWMEGGITVRAATDAEPTTHEVFIKEPKSDEKSWVFDPAEIEINAGDTIRWVNGGRATHDVMGWIGSEPPDDHHDHDGHGHGDHEESPALAPVLMVFAALGLAMAARRR